MLLLSFSGTYPKRVFLPKDKVFFSFLYLVSLFTIHSCSSTNKYVSSYRGKEKALKIYTDKSSNRWRWREQAYLSVFFCDHISIFLQIYCFVNYSIMRNLSVVKVKLQQSTYSKSSMRFMCLKLTIKITALPWLYRQISTLFSYSFYLEFWRCSEQNRIVKIHAR